MARRIGAEGRQVDDRHARARSRRVPDASGRIRRLRMNSECQAYSVTTRTGRLCAGIGAADQILHEQVALRGMRDEVGVKRVECCRRHRACCCPTRRPSAVAVVADDELVLRRAAGVLAGRGDERAVAAELGFAAADRLARRGRRPEDCSGPSRLVFRPDLVDPAGGISHSAFSHRRLPRSVAWRRLSRIGSGRSSPRPESVENRKAKRFQIINRFKDFEISFKSFI